MTRTKPAQRLWMSLLALAFVAGIGLVAASSAQACLIDSDGIEDCSFSLRKAEIRDRVTPNTDIWNADGEMNTLPSATMPDDIAQNGVGVAFGYVDSAGSSFVQVDEITFASTDCKASGSRYPRVRCKNDSGLFRLSPRSALSFVQVVVRAGKREITPALSIANTPLAVVINTPDSLHRGDSVDPCTYTAARDVKLTCKRLP